MMRYYDGYGLGCSGMGNFLGGFFQLVFIVFLIYLVVWIVKSVKGGGTFHSLVSKSPVDILKERYAKGEINKEQLESMKKDLGA